MSLFRSEYIRNISKVSIGVLIAQALSVLLSPIITRLYSPEEFGLFSVYVSIVLIIEVCACLRYEMTIVLAEDNTKAVNILWLSIGIMTIASIVVGVFVVAFYILSDSELLFFKWNNLYWLMPISVFSISAVNVMTLWCTRKKLFSIIAFIQAGIVVVNNVLSIVAGVFIGGKGEYLVYSQLLSYVLVMIVTGGLVLKNDSSILSLPRLKESKSLFREYKRMALYNTPASVINIFSQRLPAYSFPRAYGLTSVGYYDLVYRILKLPSQIIGNAIRNVFFQKASDDYNKTGSFAATLINNVKALITLSILPFLIVGALSPWLFPMAFGKEWVDSGWYVMALLPWLMTSFIVVPISSAVSITAQDKSFFRLQLLCLLARIAIIVIGISYFPSPIFTVAGFSIIGCFFQLLILKVIGKSTGVSISDVLDHKTLVYVVMSVAISAGIFILANRGLIALSLLLTAIACCYYGFYLKRNLLRK